MLGVSEAAASGLLADAVNLRHRHPATWRLVQAGHVEVWRARKVAQACAALGVEAAARVDRQIAPALSALPFGAAMKRLAGLVTAADPEAARERVESAKRDRFVSIRHTDNGTSWLVALLSTADAITLGHAVDGIARRLVEEPGYAGSIHHARSEALGSLARPAPAAGDAVGPGTVRSRLPRPEATLIVHVDRGDLGPGPGTDVAGVAAGVNGGACADVAGPVARVEGPGGLDEIGTVLLDQLAVLLAHHNVRVLPVLDLAADAVADSYDIPDRLRTQVAIRDGRSRFPFGTRRAAACDLDHTVPWALDGPSGQTRPSNLGCLDRRAHRAKTHGGWAVDQAKPGVFDWTSRPGIGTASPRRARPASRIGQRRLGVGDRSGVAEGGAAQLALRTRLDSATSVPPMTSAQNAEPIPAMCTPDAATASVVMAGSRSAGVSSACAAELARLPSRASPASPANSPGGAAWEAATTTFEVSPNNT